MALDVWVIGTNPPCPRCALLGQRVEHVMKTNDIAGICRHFGYDDSQVQQLAKSLGFQIGTAKDVARLYNVEIDLDSVTQIIARQIYAVARRRQCIPDEVSQAERWTPELDIALQPFQEIARSKGFLMTPVLVVDGVVKWHGSVPSEEWIAGQLLRR